MNSIKVLIVDDSALMRGIIVKMLEKDKAITVSAVATNGMHALRKMQYHSPDVIILDLEMPELDGIGFLKERKKRNWNIPVIILSSLAKRGAAITIEALALGASDFVTKPAGTKPNEIKATETILLDMVKALGKTYRRKQIDSGHSSSLMDKEEEGNQDQGTASYPQWPALKPITPFGTPRIIVIGISTGGPDALRQLFSRISPDITVPIVVVQHMPAGFTHEFAKSLDSICPLRVKEAESGDLLKAGRVLIAPGNKHIIVENRSLGTIVRTEGGEKRNGHKPSVGILFDSVAKTFGNAAIAVIMTGMGIDGSREIGNIYAEGGMTIAQDEKSSVVYGMPMAAVAHGYISRVENLEGIINVVNELCKCSPDSPRSSHL